jgi:ribose-phosphate pyrophosphokinase
MMSLVVFALPGQEQLAQGLAAHLSATLGQLEIRSFPDAESYVRVDTPVNGRDVVLACSLDRPNPKMIPLLFLASTLRDLGAGRILLAAPYLAYMRQDRAFRTGEGISARTFARLLSSYVDGLVTVDPHLHRIHDIGELFSIQARVVAAAPALADWISSHVEKPALVGPDSESEQWVSDVARRVNCPFVVFDKVRRGDRDVEVSLPRADELRGHVPVLVDDIVSTARTMIAATGHLLQLGLARPVCIGVHAVFSGDAFKELTGAGAKRIVTCNTIQHPSNEIDVCPLVATAIIDMLKRDQA